MLPYLFHTGVRTVAPKCSIYEFCTSTMITKTTPLHQAILTLSPALFTSKLGSNSDRQRAAFSTERKIETLECRHRQLNPNQRIHCKRDEFFPNRYQRTSVYKRETQLLYVSIVTRLDSSLRCNNVTITMFLLPFNTAQTRHLALQQYHYQNAVSNSCTNTRQLIRARTHGTQ